MATVLDELIIRLNLDPKDFTKGQKEAANSFLKTRDAAKKTGKDIEDTAKKTANELDKFARKLISIFAAIQGARGIRDLITGLTQANAELGRFGANVGLAPQRLAAWGAAVQRVGGDASQAQASIGKLAGNLTQFKMGMANLPDGLFQLQGRSGQQIDITGSTEEYLTSISAAVQKLAATDRQGAFNLAQSLGIDDATFEVMRKHGAGIQEYLATLDKVGPSNKAVDAAQKMQEAWGKLVQTLTEVSQKLYEVAAPQITKMIEALTRMFERLANEVNWEAIGDGLETFADYASKAIDSVDGLVAVTGTLFALWTGAAFTKALANMLLFRGGAAAAGAGAGAGAGAASAGATAGGAGWAVLFASFAAMLATRGSSSESDYLDASPDERQRMRDEARAIAERENKAARNDNDAFNGPASDSGWKKLLFGDAAKEDFNFREHMGVKVGNSLKVDGRDISKSNPVPVQMASGGGGSSTGSWFGKLWDWVTTPSSANAAVPSGGGGIGGLVGGGSGGGSGKSSGGGGGGPAVTGVPNIAGMTEDERNFLGLVLKYESNGRNTMNYVGKQQGIDPNKAKGYTAQGYYQILNSNWRRLAPPLGITATNAMSASLADQTKVALALKRESGQGNWVNWNPKLRAAVQRGEKAGDWGGMVPKSTGEKYVDPMVNAQGAKGSALTSSVSNDNRSSSVSNSSDTRIGAVNVNVAAGTDGEAIADLIMNRLKKFGNSSTAAAANTGPQ